MRWIDHMPEISKREPETPGSAFTVPEIPGFEERLRERRFKEEQKEFELCMLQILAMEYGL